MGTPVPFPIRCGSCQHTVNVPAGLVMQLVSKRAFNCPHCKQGQHLGEAAIHHILELQGQAQGQEQPAAAPRRQWERPERLADPALGGLEPEAAEEEEDGDEAGEAFAEYRPRKLPFGAPHPDAVVESASLAAVEPPDIAYELRIRDLAEAGTLSGLQLESVVYACQRHEQLLPGGARAGFFIGDGAGMGKGRTVAGLVLENWRAGRTRHLWVSIGADLRVDARRDLDDVGAAHIELHPLNKLQYGRLDGAKIGVTEGVVFLSYSSLISGCENGATRVEQLVQWCGGAGFKGLLVFDECHKAKNLVPDAGARPTKVGRTVQELQLRLPGARVVYCSATGASETRNMGYMERLGLWGPGTPFESFSAFLEVVRGRDVGYMEILAMDMKARGMYVCRTLAFKGVEFEICEAQLEGAMQAQYAKAAETWSQLRREFLYASEQAVPEDEDAPKRGNTLWRCFWGCHQRFFRHMCMAAKVPKLVALAQQALRDGKCVVVGLQSTGEARTADVVAERGEELDDFVSGPRELLLKLVEEYYPLPPNPDESEAGGGAAPKKRRRTAAAARGVKRARGADGEGEDGDPLAEDVRDEPWERAEGGGPAAPNPAAALAATPEGRQKLARMRAAYQVATERKAQVKAAMASVQLPHNPLDMLIDQLGGPEAVAEMTGRKGRLVRVRREGEPAAGGGSVRWEARNASGMGAGGATLEMINVHERRLFSDGVKLVAVISEAASAGISLHADKRAKNQRRRVHLTLELPWSADKAIQQFGRSHRANQAHGPHYRLLFTPLGGERRFACSVAKRLESLGALTQGDRRAGPSRELTAFNFGSKWGQEALKRFYRAILGECAAPCRVPPEALAHEGGRWGEARFYCHARVQLLAMGIMRPSEGAVHVNQYMSQPGGAPEGVGRIADADKGDVGRFLNRLLGVEPAWQARLFALYQAVREALVAAAKRSGAWDDGIADVRGTSLRLKEPERVIRRDRSTGAATQLFTVQVDRGVSWEAVCRLLREHRAAAGSGGGGAIDLESPRAAAAAGQFHVSHQKLPGAGAHAVVLALPVGGAFSLVRPTTGRAARLMPADVFASRYGGVGMREAQPLWEAAFRGGGGPVNAAGARMRELHLVGGLVLPIWPQLEASLAQTSRVAKQRLHVMRVLLTAPEKRRIVGVSLPPPAVEWLLQQLGAPTGEPAPAPLSSSSSEVVALED